MGFIKDVIVTPLQVIQNAKGNILHALKANESSFVGFGEAYFSTIQHKEVKGWKKHTEMTLNIVVPVGSIRFKLIDGREQSTTYKETMEVILSIDNYQRLTVPPGIWMGFEGIGTSTNMLLNLASIPHDPTEAIAVAVVNNTLETPLF
jgi:dTDP-4-dehydrorhamnose 3,5-epimerase